MDCFDRRRETVCGLYLGNQQTELCVGAASSHYVRADRLEATNEMLRITRWIKLASRPMIGLGLRM